MVPSGVFHLGLLALARLASVADAGTVHRRDAADYSSPPYYPAPHGGWTAGWADSYAKAKLLVEQMTLAEKVNITSGVGLLMGNPCGGNTGSIPRLGFPNLCLNDGPMGIRPTDHATVFPAGITCGATWDKELIKARGVALGKEFRGKGANLYLGPAVGALGRKPRGGRAWEGFGPDPVLQGKLGAMTIEGVQSQGVIATVKHLIGNEQEMYRLQNLTQEGYSANIDDRTLHELYLWPFADSVHAEVGAAMTAYNAVNGSFSSQNAYLINGLLKDELGFQGFVMSDWLGQVSGVPAALAGLDLAMPGDINTLPIILGQSFWMYEMSRSVLNGSVPVDRLNDMATRLVAAWYKMGQDQGYNPPNFSGNSQDEVDLLYPAAINSPKGVVNKFVDVRGNNTEVARQVAQDAITLLKNDGGLLPLSKNRTLSVFGTGADVNPDGLNACKDASCNKGTLGSGWGSGCGFYSTFDSPMNALKRNVKNVTYYQTDSFPRVFNSTSADVAIVFVSSDSGENSYIVEGNRGDRDNSGLNLWHGGDDLVKNAAAKYNDVIVVVHTVGPVIMENWINLPSVKSVLVAHLPGQEAGESLTNVLFGAVSPSGHLPYSIPVKETDYPSSTNLTLWANLTGLPFANFDGVKLPDLKNLPGLPDLNSIINLTSLGQPQDTFSEGLYIDYRYLNKNGIKPRFAFGHGLSYANFSFSNATVKRVTELSPLPPARPVKLATPSYSTDIPPASEAYWPTNFPRIERYLYPFLNQSDADNARAQASKSKYDYPVGYSEVQKPGPAAGGGEGGNPALWDTAFEVSVTVTNTDATHAGKAVAQLYVQFPDGISYDTPVVQLRDFAKTAAEIGPGASQTMTLTVTRRDVSVWDVVAQNWVVPKVDGRFKLWVGDSSDRLFTACYSDTLQCESGLPSPV